jgi:hypothetical protein
MKHPRPEPVLRLRLRLACNNVQPIVDQWHLLSLGLLIGLPKNRPNKAVPFLDDAIKVLGVLPASIDPTWVWPEPRLRYANATLAEALIAAGNAIGHEVALHSGVAMLTWLLELESQMGHLSVVGTTGRERSSVLPQFDQQPIEVAAMADACARAVTVTGDPSWERGVSLAVEWFQGANDAGLVMFDPVSGGGYDGLHVDRVNLNQGAESTLAYVSTMQQARLQERRIALLVDSKR